MSNQRLKLRLKPKKKANVKAAQKLGTAQRVALRAVQKQLQVLQLKEILIVLGFTAGAALLRIPMQAIPSAEPLTFFAILAGWLFGSRKGFVVGISSLYISNFFMFGGQGPWTVFQMAGFGVAGYLGGLLRKNATIIEILVISTIATLAFELLINLTTPLMMPGTNIIFAFALAIPFTIVHLVSNLIFSFALKPAKRFVEKMGGFDERDICVNILSKYSANIKPNWLKRILQRAAHHR
jgi:energy-coupling factor transport system substrate-specific component